MPVSVRRSIIGLGMLTLLGWAGSFNLFFHAALLAETAEETLRAGGDLTTEDASGAAYNLPARNLRPEILAKHLEGDKHFEAVFVSSPAPINAGLGPVYNNVSCLNCHPRDGRGRPDMVGKPRSSLFLRVSLPGKDPVTGSALPVPGWGFQLADKAIYGKAPEGRMLVTYREEVVTYPDGQKASLRHPEYEIDRPSIEVPENLLKGPRIAPPVFGRGLLEAVPESLIRALEDPDDRDGDDISGRANLVWDVQTQSRVLGRFGWKANQPNLYQQNAAAYAEDMGVSNHLFPADEPDVEGGSVEDLDPRALDLVTLYVQTLGVPARRNLEDTNVQAGERFFHELQCAACHVPTLKTGSYPEDAAIPELANQTFQPYSDLLLHDMGPALADGRPDFEASGSEWRTPPLWGIGLNQVVSGHTFFLHDGRARSLEEAILWHGGEAEKSKQGFMHLSKRDRDAVIAFLESL